MEEKLIENNTYLAPAKKVRRIFKVQGSKFIATLAPAVNEDQAREILFSVTQEFPGATHHAYAIRIGAGAGLLERSSDDGEPADSAGAPMIQVINGKGVSDILVIGTRYFGGRKLGIGGLTRAYRDCARLTLEEAILYQKEPLVKYRLELAYEDLGTVTRLLENLEGEVLESEYSEQVGLTVSVPARLKEVFTDGFKSVCRGGGRYSKL